MDDIILFLLTCCNCMSRGASLLSSLLLHHKTDRVNIVNIYCVVAPCIFIYLFGVNCSCYLLLLRVFHLHLCTLPFSICVTVVMLSPHKMKSECFSVYTFPHFPPPLPPSHHARSHSPFLSNEDDS